MTKSSLRTRDSLRAKQRHWTAANADSFAHKVAFDFISQIEKTLNERGYSRAELAERLGVSQGAVSQVLNNPQNLTLKTVAKYSQSLGLKTAVVAYEDGDPENRRGLINSQVFVGCWQKLNKPTDLWAVEENDLMRASTNANVQITVDYCNVMIGISGTMQPLGLASGTKEQCAATLSYSFMRTTAQLCAPVALHNREVTHHG